MAEPAITVWAGFRAHVLLPHRLVGSVIDDKPTFHGLDLADILRVEKHGACPKTHVTLTALEDVWLQEAGLTVKIARADAIWRGFGRNNQWTSPPHELSLRDPHRGTIHFSRVRFLGHKPNPAYTIGVEYRANGKRWRLYSNTGFSTMLNEPAGEVPWEGCDVFGRGWNLAGTISDPNRRPLRRWELAGHATDDQMHFHSWAGGAGAVVQGVPPYRADQIKHPGVPIDRLWDPASWRLLKRGRKIEQSVWMKRLA